MSYALLERFYLLSYAFADKRESALLVSPFLLEFCDIFDIFFQRLDFFENIFDS